LEVLASHARPISQGYPASLTPHPVCTSEHRGDGGLERWFC
jgi:hypothetical protein